VQIKRLNKVSKYSFSNLGVGTLSLMLVSASLIPATIDPELNPFGTEPEVIMSRDNCRHNRRDSGLSEPYPLKTSGSHYFELSQ
jgi:hypothetical protein